MAYAEIWALRSNLGALLGISGVRGGMGGQERR
jgi:hypothetical protein